MDDNTPRVYSIATILNFNCNLIGLYFMLELNRALSTQHYC